MPHVEVVPNSTAQAAAPGWAYVPDTGFDPSKAPLVPTGSRKRARNAQTGAASRAEITARQQSRIAKHLTELDKENHKDVQIVVPNRGKDVGSRGFRGVMKPGVRKIVQSQKTFANHLADEEAAIANQQHHPVEPVPTPRLTPAKPARKPGRPRKSTLKDATEANDAMDIDRQGGGSARAEDDQDGTFADDDGIPFLRTPVPTLPTQEEIAALLSAPPLSYSAARAAPSASTAPKRQFCEMCGYWGRARCMKCGVRVCGLECKNQHEETRCLKFYA